MCEGRVDVIQSVKDDALKYCPWCGLDVKRVVSRATFKVAGTTPDDKASKKGFTTFRKAEKGIWEKVSGEGPDLMSGTKEDIAAIDEEKAPKRPVIDLDNES